jgi:hypothetical protein
MDTELLNRQAALISANLIARKTSASRKISGFHFGTIFATFDPSRETSAVNRETDEMTRNPRAKSRITVL